MVVVTVGLLHILGSFLGRMKLVNHTLFQCDLLRQGLDLCLHIRDGLFGRSLGINGLLVVSVVRDLRLRDFLVLEQSVHAGSDSINLLDFCQRCVLRRQCADCGDDIADLGLGGLQLLLTGNQLRQITLGQHIAVVVYQLVRFLTQLAGSISALAVVDVSKLFQFPLDSVDFLSRLAQSRLGLGVLIVVGNILRVVNAQVGQFIQRRVNIRNQLDVRIGHFHLIGQGVDEGDCGINLLLGALNCRLGVGQILDGIAGQYITVLLVQVIDFLAQCSNSILIAVTGVLKSGSFVSGSLHGIAGVVDSLLKVSELIVVADLVLNVNALIGQRVHSGVQVFQCAFCLAQRVERSGGLIIDERNSRIDFLIGLLYSVLGVSQVLQVSIGENVITVCRLQGIQAVVQLLDLGLVAVASVGKSCNVRFQRVHLALRGIHLLGQCHKVTVVRNIGVRINAFFHQCLNRLFNSLHRRVRCGKRLQAGGQLVDLRNNRIDLIAGSLNSCLGVSQVLQVGIGENIVSILLLQGRDLAAQRTHRRLIAITGVLEVLDVFFDAINFFKRSVQLFFRSFVSTVVSNFLLHRNALVRQGVQLIPNLADRLNRIRRWLNIGRQRSNICLSSLNLGINFINDFTGSGNLVQFSFRQLTICSGVRCLQVRSCLFCGFEIRLAGIVRCCVRQLCNSRAGCVQRSGINGNVQLRSIAQLISGSQSAAFRQAIRAISTQSQFLAAEGNRGQTDPIICHRNTDRGVEELTVVSGITQRNRGSFGVNLEACVILNLSGCIHKQFVALTDKVTKGAVCVVLALARQVESQRLRQSFGNVGLCLKIILSNDSAIIGQLNIIDNPLAKVVLILLRVRALNQHGDKVLIGGSKAADIITGIQKRLAQRSRLWQRFEHIRVIPQFQVHCNQARLVLCGSPRGIGDGDCHLDRIPSLDIPAVNAADGNFHLIIVRLALSVIRKCLRCRIQCNALRRLRCSLRIIRKSLIGNHVCQNGSRAHSCQQTSFHAVLSLSVS